jgi:hypothetical protein
MGIISPDNSSWGWSWIFYVAIPDINGYKLQASFNVDKGGKQNKIFLQSSIEKLILKQINFKQNKFKFLPNDVKDIREGHLWWHGLLHLYSLSFLKVNASILSFLYFF